MRVQGGRRLNVSGVLRCLGVSRSGYNSWKNKIPSNREQRKNIIKNKICDIYDESKQNYGAPKITKKKYPGSLPEYFPLIFILSFFCVSVIKNISNNSFHHYPLKNCSYTVFLTFFLVISTRPSFVMSITVVLTGS